MTYFFDCGVLVYKRPETLFCPTYRIMRSYKTQLAEMKELSKIPQDYDTFNFLVCEEGHSVYTTRTPILPLLQYKELPKGSPVNPLVDIEALVLDVLNSYKKGFMNLFFDIQHRDEQYKCGAMQELFKIIAKQITELVRGR